MGSDPEGDYPDHPYFYRRNAIPLAAEMGVGPMRPDEIDVIGPVPEKVCVPFQVERYDGDTNRHDQLVRGRECVEDIREDLSRRSTDDTMAGTSPSAMAVSCGTRRMCSPFSAWNRRAAVTRTAPQLVVRCLPPDEEIEQMDWARS